MFIIHWYLLPRYICYLLWFCYAYVKQTEVKIIRFFFFPALKERVHYFQKILSIQGNFWDLTLDCVLLTGKWEWFVKQWLTLHNDDDT